jgi:predicted enzyme related to lactoylglutathione lyase
MPNPFVHLELTTPDRPVAKEFYGKLFGWNFQDHDMGGGMVYSTFTTDNGPGGGIFTMPGAPTDWLPYVGVAEINAATEKAISLGAKLLRGPQEVPGRGMFSIMIDPTGAAIALWEPKSA